MNRFVNKHQLTVARRVTGLVILYFCLCLCYSTAFGQAAKNDSLKLIDRFSFRTNAAGWLMLCPNVGVEFDIQSGDYNKWTVVMDALYNWNTKQTKVNPYVFDMAQVTVEGRKYYRTHRPKAGIPIERDTLLPAFTSWVKYLTRLERKNARSWRAYYFGAYASATKYSFKFGDVGYQGPAYSIGGSFGYGVPLYQMKHGTLDLEIGCRVGFAITQSDAYSVDTESDCYPHLSEKSKGMYFIPYPVVNDLHVSIIYRTLSIRKKYRVPNYKKQLADEERMREVEIRRDSIREAKRMRQDEMRSQVEILNKAKKAKKLRKHQADSLGVALDSIPLLPDELKAQQLLDRLEQERLEQDRLERESKKSRKKGKGNDTSEADSLQINSEVATEKEDQAETEVQPKSRLSRKDAKAAKKEEERKRKAEIAAAKAAAEAVKEEGKEAEQ